MKKVLMIILINFVFVGCTIPINQSEPPLVTMIVKENNVTSSSIAILLTNHSDSNISHGVGFGIQYYSNGFWFNVDTLDGEEPSFILKALVLEANQTVEIEYNWQYIYGDLSPGTYRFYKIINNQQISAEFTIN